MEQDSWEYLWVETCIGEADRLTEYGALGWEAIGVTQTGTYFGKSYASILFKRARQSVDLTDALASEESRFGRARAS